MFMFVDRYGWFVTSLLVDPSKYLPYLMNKWVPVLLTFDYVMITF